MKTYNPWDFCRSINCNSMIRTEEQRKVLTCPNCKAYQMHDYLREHGQIIEEDSPLLKELEQHKRALELASVFALRHCACSRDDEDCPNNHECGKCSVNGFLARAKAGDK